MQAVKATGSKIETALSKELFKRGYRYRKNNRKVFGKPDLTFAKLKIAVFVDSEFWHGKDWEIRKHDHKSNQDFWHAKIEQNIKRDLQVNTELKKQGWTILRFWGKDIQSNLLNCIATIEKEILKKKNEISRKNLT